MAKPKLGFEFTAEDKTASAFESLHRNIGLSNRALQSLGGGIGATAFVAFLAHVTDGVDELADFAGQLDISITALSRLQYAASTVGIGADKFNGLLQKMEKNLGDIAEKGTGPAADALRAIGVRIEDIKDLDPEQAFSVIAEGISRVSNQNDRARITSDLFSKSGAKLLRLFKDGAAGLDAYSEAADRLGFTFTDKAAAGFDGAASAIETFTAGIVAASRTIALEFAPAFATIVGFLGEKLPAAAQKGADALTLIKLTETAIASSIAQGLGRTEAADILRDQTNAYIDSLRKQGKAADEGIEHFDGLAASAAAYVHGALENTANETKRAADAQKELNAELQLAKGYYEATRTPAEELAATLLEIEQLRNKGRFKDANTADRAALAAEIKAEEDLAKSAINPKVEAAKKRGVDLFNETRTASEKNLIAQQELNKLYDEGAISFDVYSRAGLAAMIAEEEAIDGIGKGLNAGDKAIKKVLDEIQRNVDQTADGIVDAFFDSGTKIGDIFENLAITIAKSFFKASVADPLSKAFSSFIGPLVASLGGSGSSGGFTDLSQLGFGRAKGGPLGDRPTLVGENGPELIDGAGNVRPGGGGAVNITFNVNSLDPRTAAAVIVANRDAIVGVVRGAFGRQGTKVQLA